MEALFVNSPLFRSARNDADDYLPPLGLGYIATAVNLAGVKATILDAVHDQLGVENIIEMIDTLKPDYVGINIFTPNYDLVREIVEKSSPKTGFFVGGQVVKSLFGSILDWDVYLDLNVIIGEGEFIIPSILNGTCTEQPLVSRSRKRVFQVNNKSEYFPSDISNLPLDRGLFKNDIIKNHYGFPEAAIITSRGCPFDCAFCGGARSLNRDITIRTRSELSIVREIEGICSDSPKVKSIRILDDLFLKDANSINSAIRLFEHFPHLYWRGMAHIKPIIENTNRIQDLREARCKELFIGIESGSDRIRHRIKKTGSIEDIRFAASSILKSGIDLKAYFIYGFPGETQQDFEATYRLAFSIAEESQDTPGAFRTSVFQFKPYHGTKLYNELFDTDSPLPSFGINEALASVAGRTQFSLSAGNFSNEPDDVVNYYINETMKLPDKQNA